jgi:hypothetical protein
MRYMANFEAKLRTSNLLSRRRVIGCSDAQVEAIENRLHVHFPNAHREFLQVCGGNAGDFLRGSEYRASELETIQETLRDECAAEQFPVAWPTDAIAFIDHQGYWFALYRNTGEPDPLVFIVKVGFGVEETGLSFSEFMLKELQKEIALHQQHIEHSATKNRRQ